MALRGCPDAKALIAASGDLGRFSHKHACSCAMIRAVIDTSGLVRVLEDAPDVELAVLFGSAARDEVRPSSDIDIAVLVRQAPGDEFSSGTPDPHLAVRLERVCGRAVEVVDLRTASPLLRFEVARDGRPLVERRPFVWSDFRVRASTDWWDWAPLARRIHEAAARRARAAAAVEMGG